MRKPHADGSPCKPIGICIPCTVGNHEGCMDSVAIIGCACPCTIDENDLI